MIRVCIYHYEMGAFRRAWIQTVTRKNSYIFKNQSSGEF